MKEQLNNSTKTDKKKKKYDTHLLSPHANPNINEPPSNLYVLYFAR